MNIMDYSVIAIMLACGIIGLVSGFVRTIFRLSSFFIAVIIAVSFYPVLANYIIEKTPIYETVKTVIEEKLLSRTDEQALEGENDGQAKETKKTVDLTKLPLPNEFKQQIEAFVANASEGTTTFIENKVQNVTDSMAGSFARVIINILSAIIIFAIVSTILTFIRTVLEWIAELPVFNQLNKAGGFILGAIEGLLIVYFICAILSLFSTSEHFKDVFKSMNSSIYAKHIYYNNFLLNWIFSSRLKWGF